MTATGVPGCTVRLIGAPGTVAVAAAAPDGSATLRATTRPRDTGYLRAEVRRPLPTATTPDSMVAMSNPVFLGLR